ncbi:COX15/CtaA family protein [Cellulomonas endophytica]|uniref:COX15/CtaA family protein n=1 Tax=Cellulomonas endophytica TaxID=2494735 RepID=UPI001F0CA8AA|nr:COX15/CtaA family protein [Cellulomonas endophytica]
MSLVASGTALLDRLRPRWTRRVLVANLVAQIAIVATGGLVRLTGSGLGCSTWPQCEPGSFVPVRHSAVPGHQAIEFGNRMLTFALVVVAVAVALLVLRDRGRSATYRRLGLVPVVGVLVQAVVGGISVLVDLAPAVVGAHFLLSMVLVAASAYLLLRHDEGDAPASSLVGRAERVLVGALWAALVVVLVLGVVVTGAGPHSGDESRGYRFALDPYLVARVHAAAVWVFVGLLAALLVRLRRTGAARTRRAGSRLLVVTLAQALIGYVQLFTGLPIALVNLHLVGAAGLVAATTWLHGTTRVRTGGGAVAPVAPGTTPAPELVER